MTTGKINLEPVYVVSADQSPSMKLDLNEKSGVSAPENFEFGIAGTHSIMSQQPTVNFLHYHLGFK